MNPEATSWSPNAAAAEWKPSFAVPVQAPAPAPAPAPAENDEEDIDENDPLWIAVLKIAENDRFKAKKMIANPDNLLKYPEIAALLGSDEAGDDIVMEPSESCTSERKTVDMVVEGTEKLSISSEKKVAPAVPKPAPKRVEPETEKMEVEEEVDDADPREHVNLVFIGHVDAGKSTLSGNILYLTDNVDKRTIEKYEREAKELNRESWFLAFIMDTNDEERAKGKTVEVGRATFETEEKRYTILDAPGHKNYVPNMIMGASQADVGVLVISARKGEFETGFDRGGQTREHAMLAKTLGVDHLVVVINKMDDPTVEWKKPRFDECVSKLKPFLKGCGYKVKKEVKFIPISGLAGDNVKDEVSTDKCRWWQKYYNAGENNTTSPTLFHLLDSLTFPNRDSQGSIRIPILDRYSDRGTIAMGKVESGTVRPGMKIMMMPTRNEYKITGLWAGEEPINCAKPGENVLVKLNQCGTEDAQKGFVICSAPYCRAVTKFIAEVAILDMPDNQPIMTAGFEAIFHCHTCEEPCAIVKIFETIDRKGTVNKKAAFAKLGMRVVCMVETSQTIPVDTFSQIPFMGRFTLRTEGKTIGIGKITKLPPKKE